MTTVNLTPSSRNSVEKIYWELVSSGIVLTQSELNLIEQIFSERDRLISQSQMPARTSLDLKSKPAVNKVTVIAQSSIQKKT